MADGTKEFTALDDGTYESYSARRLSYHCNVVRSEL